MFKFKPIHGIAVVAAVVLGGVVLSSGGAADPHQRVTAGKDGAVRIGIADLHPEQVRFYRYLNPANQEVDFFVGRDGEGTVQAAFDASENHHKLRRGFRFENGWIVDNKCGSTLRLSAVNAGEGDAHRCRCGIRWWGRRCGSHRRICCRSGGCFTEPEFPFVQVSATRSVFLRVDSPPGLLRFHRAVGLSPVGSFLLLRKIPQGSVHSSGKPGRGASHYR